MGRLEKIVVLTVLFLVAVVLGVALNGGGKDLKKNGPLKLTANPAETAPVESASAPKPEERPAGLLNSSVDASAGSPAPAAPPTAAPAAPKNELGALDQPPSVTPAAGQPVTPAVAAAPVKIEPGAFLLTRDGLEESKSSELMLYTWKAGDTFASVAERYYGSKDKVGRLKSSNEGRVDKELQPGEKIWVPAVDSSTVRAAQNAGGTLYVVKSGDVLSTISQSVYGTSKKWNKIFDANRDVLSDANAIRVGMRLRIPE
jgi:nucleoid-associated protein YgaU